MTAADSATTINQTITADAVPSIIKRLLSGFRNIILIFLKTAIS